MKKWFVLKNDKKHGPYAKDELFKFYDVGSLKDIDLIVDEQTGVTCMFIELLNDQEDEQEINDVTLPSLPIDSFKTKTNITVPDLPPLDANESEDEENTIQESIDEVLDEVSDNKTDVTIPGLPLDDFKTKTNLTIPELPEFNKEEEITEVIKEEIFEINEQKNLNEPPEDDIPLPPEDFEEESFEQVINDEFQEEEEIQEVEIQGDETKEHNDELGGLTREVQLAKVGFEEEGEVDDEADLGLTREVQLAQFKLADKNDVESAEKKIEIEIIEKDKTGSKKKLLITILAILLFILIALIAVVFMVENESEKDNSIKKLDLKTKKTINKKINNDFEKDFIPIKSFSAHPMLLKMIQDKSRGMDLKIDGEVLSLNTCYQGNFLALKGDVPDTENTKFRITKVIKRYPKKVKFFKYKCVKHDVEATLEQNLGFGKLVTLKVFYCPVYVDKAFSFKRKYNLTQKCYGIKDFEQCWQRASKELIAKSPYELITKENVAKEYIEMVTFITHEKVRLENSDAMKTFKRCEN